MKKQEMTSRERVLGAVNGETVDRVPVMYWLNSHAAVKCMALFEPARKYFPNLAGTFLWKRFKNGGEMNAKELWRAMPLLYQKYAVNEYAVALGSDMAEVPYGTNSYWGKVYRDNGKIRVKDVFGCTRGIGGIYLEMIEPCIKEIKDLENYQFPDTTHDKHYDGIRKFRHQHPGACIYTSNFGVQDLPSTQMWGMEKMMMAFVDYPDEVKSFQKRLADWSIDIGIRSIKAGADIIFIYDDYGYTDRTLISMNMWKEFTFPHLKRMIEVFHEEGAKVMLHSCGFQMPFLEYYAGAGLDILQTFQPKAGNNFEKAYGEYGDRLTFNTGIDIQQGESMSPETLKEDILRAYRIGGRNSRHILGMTHMMQYTMPIENIKTIFETTRDIQAGKYD